MGGIALRFPLQGQQGIEFFLLLFVAFFLSRRRSASASTQRSGAHVEAGEREGPVPGAVRELSQVFALAVPHEEALRIRDDVAFFQAVQAVLAKRAPGDAACRVTLLRAEAEAKAA